MEPDRATNSGDNLTAARDYLTRAAMQLDQASTRREAGKKCTGIAIYINM